MKPFKTLVLVANEREARLLVNRGTGKGLAEVTRFSKAHEIEYADGRGRDQGGATAGRHAMEPPTSLRVQNREGFAADVLGLTAEVWAKGDYDRFVMAAPPKMLGELRNRIEGSLERALAVDIDKDIVGVAAADLPRHFEDVIVF
ncbi:host attachment protein [Rhodovulum sulfidophilum]|uniref:baeRF12 domain-containing protein n=1 Tax=Rhodovulum sulfidophilum TaxID=35806 RepID=UPI001921E426|nr:host attachment protein [Rhodovulum sulfidophilum]MBL3595178.1 host attachment protein [Rhodovulum sulfidophilum]